MLDQSAVPQELHEKGHDNNEQHEHNYVINCLLLVTGLENIKHLFIRG
jgi:hypothetical protein